MPEATLSPNSAVPAGLKKAFDAVPDGVTKHAAGVLFVAPDGDILLLRRSNNEENFAGHWALPGGGVEDDETPETGAAREVKEETGFDAEPSAFKKLDRTITPTGAAFHTFAQPVDDKFVPRLNSEHSGYAWGSLNMLPRPMHPAVERTLKDRLGLDDNMSLADREVARDSLVKWSRDAPDACATDRALTLALDRDPSVRELDRDGRLRIRAAHITKANICPYRGKEIPGWKALGLDPDKIYQLLRDPDELKKAVPTFDGLPLLRRHVRVSAVDHKPYDVVGSLGSDAEFDGTYINNSLFVNAQQAIDWIESGEKKELSAGYYYKPDMTPGIFDGSPFDGVMREISGNHIAIVEDGRAGPDVVVGDAALDSQEKQMTKPTRLAATALRLTARAVNPLLAMDQKVDLMPIFQGITTKNFDPKKLTTAVGAAIKGKTLAMDVNIEHVAKMLDHVGEAGKAEPTTADESVSEPQHKAMMAAAEGKSNLGIPKEVGSEFKNADAGNSFDGVMAWGKSKGLGEDDMEELSSMWPKPATDEDPEAKTKDEEDESDEAAKKKEAANKAAKDARTAKDAEMKDMVTKPAMDAALKATADETAKTVRATERGIRSALAEVRPWVGELPHTLAFDSAEEVYRHTATMMGITNAKTLHSEALWPVIQAQPKPGARRQPQYDDRMLGMDSAALDEATKIAPGLAHITIGA